MVKYVLIKLERKQNKHSIPISTSIEHICPESSQTMCIDPKLIKNIGNLVLLEDDINSRIGNKNYKEKKDYVLKHSKLQTAKVLFNTYETWETSEICQRKENLVTEMYEKMWE